MTTDQISLDPNRTTVLAMDCQNSIVSIYCREPDLIPRAEQVLTLARSPEWRDRHKALE